MESEKAGVAKLTNNSKVTGDNELVNKFNKYKRKFELSASEANKMINDTKRALEAIKKMKKDAENKTAVNPANEIAKIVLSECTDSEGLLEKQLLSLSKLHKERVDSVNDMHTRAQKQVGTPTGAVADNKNAAPTLDEANPNVGAVAVDF